VTSEGGRAAEGGRAVELATRGRRWSSPPRSGWPLAGGSGGGRRMGWREWGSGGARESASWGCGVWGVGDEILFLG
jgi:hypothetical protein